MNLIIVRPFLYRRDCILHTYFASINENWLILFLVQLPAVHRTQPDVTIGQHFYHPIIDLLRYGQMVLVKLQEKHLCFIFFTQLTRLARIEMKEI